MGEIWFPEIITAVFLLSYLLRPLVKALWPLDGLVWLPLLALGITVGIFPAYGFRPECIPLLLFEIVIVVRSIPSLVSSAASRESDDFRDRSPFFTFLAIVFLGAVLAVMFTFSPKIQPGLISAGVTVRKIRDEGRNRDYFLRIYGPEQGGGPAPLVFLIPPEAGSVAAVDRICAGLRDMGFTVTSYSRKDFDFPARDEQNRPYFVSLSKVNAMWRAFRRGTELTDANEQGKALEAERLSDIEFLLPRISALAGDPAREAPLFLVGYGAGGSALILISASAGFAGRFDHVKGIVAVESMLWSTFRSDPPVFPGVPKNAPAALRFRAEAGKWLEKLKVRRVTGMGPLPLPGVPVLGLVSAGGEDRGGENPRRALVETLRNAPVPAALAVIEGAGPLDYGDYPLSHPLYSFLFPGRETGAAKSANLPVDTAGVICNFAAALGGGAAGVMPAKQNVGAKVHLETRGLPAFLP
jgi:hypothetical protein